MIKEDECAGELEGMLHGPMCHEHDGRWLRGEPLGPGIIPFSSDACCKSGSEFQHGD